MTKQPARVLGLGPQSSAWLRAVGITTHAELARVGPVGALLRVKAAGYPGSLNLLWALEGALTHTRWTDIPPARRDELRRAVAAAEAQDEPR